MTPAMEPNRRITAIEAALGKRLIVRAVHTPEPELRGYVEVRPGSVLIEYSEAEPGYFWGYELLERLLTWVEGGGGSTYFYEVGGRLVRVPVGSACSEGREG